jgi:hypothetical protein
MLTMSATNLTSKDKKPRRQKTLEQKLWVVEEA